MRLKLLATRWWEDITDQWTQATKWTHPVWVILQLYLHELDKQCAAKWVGLSHEPQWKLSCEKVLHSFMCSSSWSFSSFWNEQGRKYYRICRSFRVNQSNGLQMSCIDQSIIPQVSIAKLDSSSALWFILGLLFPTGCPTMSYPVTSRSAVHTNVCPHEQVPHPWTGCVKNPQQSLESSFGASVAIVVIVLSYEADIKHQIIELVRIMCLVSSIPVQAHTCLVECLPISWITFSSVS